MPPKKTPKKTAAERARRQGDSEERSDDDGGQDDPTAINHQNDEVNTNAAAGTSASQAQPYVFNAEHFVSTFMRAFAESQAEVNRNLVETLRATTLTETRASAAVTPTSNASEPAAAAASAGNFSRCTARFDGRSRDPEVVEAFLDAVETFKECTAVSDEHAVRGLAMLLEGDAAVWWRGMKTSVTSWQDAADRLRGMYGAPRPGYELLREMFKAEQQNERAEAFACRIRALIVRLPYDVPEPMKIDIIYGLLDRRIKKRVLRDDVVSVDSLIDKIRIAEDNIKQVSKPVGTPNIPGNGTNAAAPRASENRSIFSTRNEGPISCASDNKSKRNRVRCSFCKVYGHVVEECRNLKSKTDAVGTSSSANGVSEPIRGTDNSKVNEPIRCYGCGKQGVIRSKCDNCNASKQCDFNFNYDVCATSLHPMLSLGILGREGVAIADTGSTHCIASPSLYNILVDEGVSFQTTRRSLRLADGSQQSREVRTADVPVTIEGREFIANFMVIPNENTKTLLGFEFLSKAGIVLDGCRNSWSFADDPGRHFSFVRNYRLRSAEDAELMRAETLDLSLRSDQGPRPSPNQRHTLDDFINTRSAQFARYGPTGPTNDCDPRYAVVGFPARTPGDVRDNQRKDPEVRKVIEDLEADHVPARGRQWADRDYVLSDGDCVTLGKYCTSQLTPSVGDVQPAVKGKLKRGRPRRY